MFLIGQKKDSQESVNNSNASSQHLSSNFYFVSQSRCWRQNWIPLDENTYPRIQKELISSKRSAFPCKIGKETYKFKYVGKLREKLKTDRTPGIRQIYCILFYSKLFTFLFTKWCDFTAFLSWMKIRKSFWIMTKW